MPSGEVQEKELRRLQYLEAMGIETYVARQILPGALPSVVFDWPEPASAPSQTVSDSMLADKSALQKLQQDLGSVPRKVPAANKTASMPAPNVVPVKRSPDEAGVVQFQLAIFQPARELLILVPAQHTDVVHLQLLKSILWAITVKPESLVPTDNFVWPPRVTNVIKTKLDFHAAQETLQAFLEGYQMKSGIKNVLVFAGVLAEKLFTPNTAVDQPLADLNVFSLPDLQQMLQDSAYKKITWQKICSLVP